MNNDTKNLTTDDAAKHPAEAIPHNFPNIPTTAKEIKNITNSSKIQNTNKIIQELHRQY
jgi:hypothetical protein